MWDFLKLSTGRTKRGFLPFKKLIFGLRGESSDECVTFGSSSLGGTALTGAGWEGGWLLEMD